MWYTCCMVVMMVGFFVALGVGDAMAMGGGGRFVDVNSGGCVNARLCCPGKDITCSVYERRTEDAPGATRCFCDSDCLATGDCCHDYRDYCQPVDCLLDETWQKWGKCSVPCGMGVRNRTRRIRRYPRNGGNACESTLQYGTCEGVNCKVPRTLSTVTRKLKEIALILPISVAKWRNYSTHSDIRRNLQVKGRFSHRSINGASRDSENYCVIYRVTEVGRMCNAPSSSINGSPTAAAAEAEAEAGEGAPAGRILTNWTTDLVSGMVICVECQPTAADPDKGERCQGDGVYARQTRWAALTVAGCKGKWTMIEKPRDCQCQGRSYSDQDQHIQHQQKNFIFV